MKLFKQAIDTAKKPAAKAATPAQTSNASKPAAKAKDNAKGKGKKDETYAVPITIRTGYSKDATLSADSFGGKTDGITEAEIKKSLLAVYPWLGDEATTKLYKFADNSFVAAVSGASVKAVKEIDISAETTFYCGSRRLDAWSESGLAEGKIACSELAEKLVPGLVGDVISLPDKNAVILVPGKAKLSKAVKVPVELTLFNGQKKTVGSEEILKFREATGEKKEKPAETTKDEAEDDFLPVDETEDEIIEEVEEISAEELEKVLRFLYPTLTECGEVYTFTTSDKSVGYTFRVVAKDAANKVFAPKKRTFEITEGTKIRYLPYGAAADVEISPASFDGKTEVEEEDIWKFSKEIFEEFDEKNSFLDELNSERFGHLITVGRKSGSSKGAKGWERISSRVDGVDFLYEKTPTYTATVSEITSRHESPDIREAFQLNVPKIPKQLFYDVVTFFEKVAHQHNTEALCRFYYDGKEYHVAIPEQKCSHAAVVCERPAEAEEEEGTLILEVHSHGTINPFFSAVDDADEVFSGLYGVIGDFGHAVEPGAVDAFWRVVVGKMFAYIDLEDLFDEDGDDDELYNASRHEGGENLYKDWLTKASLNI